MNGETKNGWSRPVQRIAAVIFAILFATAFISNLLPSHPELRPKTLFLLFGIFAGSCVAFYFVMMWVFRRPAELSKKLPVRSKELRRKRQRFYDSLPK
jgi:hypothetical protein